MPFVDVNCKPLTFKGRRQNNIRVNGSGTFGIWDVDYDVKVYSLLAKARQHAVISTTRPSLTDSLIDLVPKRLIDDLRLMETLAETIRPLAPGGFQALAFSIGGLMAKSTVDEVQRWRTRLGMAVHGRMMGNVSLALLRARAGTFDMGIPTMAGFNEFE